MNDGVRRISPPNLSDAHLDRRILCYRPVRHGSPKMAVERRVDLGKIVVNNYGHGGSGWTLAPGCANYVNKLLLDSEYAREFGLNSHSRIAVIGAGVLGLFTAYDLLKKGFQNITIYAERFENLASDNAGGLFAFVSMDNDFEAQKLVDKLINDAHKFYSLVAQKLHPDFGGGARVIPLYCQSRETSGLEPCVASGFVKPAKDVLIDFGNGTTRAMVAYDDALFCETAKMMRNLRDYLKANGVKFVRRKIAEFSELDERIIANCSGIGSAELNKDKAISPVQGHLILLKNQDQSELEYMILCSAREGKTSTGQKVKRSFYFFPKCLDDCAERDVGVVGGTFIEGGNESTPNEDEFGILLENARTFFGIGDKCKL